MTKEDTEKGDNLVDGEEEQPKSRKTLYIGIGIAAGLVIIGVIIGVLIYVLKKKDDNNNNDDITKLKVIKPKIDTAEYKLVNVQSNGESLEVMLISDNNISKSGASISVHTGSLTDFINFDGLAHLTEHGIFGQINGPDGQKLYDKNYLLTYCSQNGGTINAMTSEEYTSYLFEINPGDPYDKALEILGTLVFTQQFIDDQIFQEVMNVNSEYINSFILDDEKLSQLIKSLSRKDGPYSQLTVGNLETLRDAKTQEEFKKTVFRYYSSYYVTKNMKLVLRAPLSLDELQKKAEKFFAIKPAPPKSQADDKSKNETYYENLYVNINAFPTENLKRYAWWKPNSSIPTVQFAFYIGQNYKIADDVNAHALVQYHINSQHANSLSDKLQVAKFATKVECQIDNEYSDFSLLLISVELTDLGLNNIKQVGSYVLAYLNKIKDSDYTEAIKEIKDNYQKTFDFTEKDSDIFDAIEENTRAMHKSNKEDILYREFSFKKHTNEAQNAFLNLLTVNNLVIIIGSNDIASIADLFDLNEYPSITEPFYQTKYAYNEIPDKDVDTLNTPPKDIVFSLRVESKFHSKKTDLTDCGTKEQCNTQRYNVDLKDGLTNAKVLFKYNKDLSFRTPKVAGFLEISFTYDSTDEDKNNKNIIATNIFFNYVKGDNKLSSIIAELTDAGNTVDLVLQPKSIVLSFNIYSDVVSRAVGSILEIFVGLKGIDSNLFNDLSKNLINKFKDAEIDMPRNKVLRIAQRVLTGHKLPSELITPISDLTFDQFSNLIADINKSIKYKLLFVGDVTEEAVKQTAETLAKLIPVPSVSSLAFLSSESDHATLKDDVPAPKLNGCYNVINQNTVQNEVNNAITNLYLVPNGENQNATDKNRKIAKLIVMAFGGTYFDNLRTEDKLGYYVRSLDYTMDGQQYINISLMGPYNSITKNTPATFDRAIDDLTKSKVKTIIEGLKQEDVDKLEKAYTDNQKKDSYYLLTDKADDLFESFDFGRKVSNEKSELKADDDKVTLAELQNLFSDMFIAKAKRLSIQLYYTGAIYQKDDTTPYYLNNGITIKNKYDDYSFLLNPNPSPK